MVATLLDLRYEEIEVGMEIPQLVKHPTNVALFRYSSVTWNAHRIHYDKSWAQQEGYPDILVQAHLHGAYLTQMIMDWITPIGVLRKLSWSNRKFAVPGDTLTCKGRVTGKSLHDATVSIECDIWEENQHGEICASGTASIALLASE